jgi:DNA polymerase-1
VNEVAWDTETRGLDWFDENQRAFLASWADATSEEAADLSDEAQTDRFLGVMESADVIIAHNLPFDTHQTRETTGFDVLESGAELHDTDTMSRVMYPEGQRDNGGRGGHGLKNLAFVHLGHDSKDAEDHILALGKEMGLKLKGDNADVGAYYDVYRAYPGPMEKYARDDARFTFDIFQQFRSKMTAAQRKVYELEMAVMPVLIRAEARGVAVDQDPVLRLRKDYYEKQARSREYLEKELGEAALGGEGSEDALIEALQSCGIPLYQKTDSGKLATNAYVLGEFEDDFPVIAGLFEYRNANKFLKTYIEPMVGRDVVHPSFMQIGAWTGRMSCRRPNMQNIPKRAGKEVREMFVPRDGFCFVVSDYESIEMRLLGHYLGSRGKTFAKMMDDGGDPLSWLTSKVHGGVELDYAKGTDGQPIRDKTKHTLYAINYGAGGKRVTEMNGLDPGPFFSEDHPAVQQARDEGHWWPKPGWQYAEGRALAKKIKKNIPGYFELQRRIRDKIEAVGHVNTIWGRVQPVNPDKAYVGLNALIQGSAADIMKQGLVNVAEAIAPLGGLPILVVHDEVVSEVPIEHAAEAQLLQDEAMIAAYDLYPRLSVESTIVHTNYAAA